MIQKILEQCQKGSHGVGFNEVVLMLYNPVATAEVYMNMDDIQFTDDGNTVTFMAENGTHLHMKLGLVKELRFQYAERNERGEPSYSVWFLDANQESVTQIGSGNYQSATPSAFYGAVGDVRRIFTIDELNKR